MKASRPVSMKKDDLTKLITAQAAGILSVQVGTDRLNMDVDKATIRPGLKASLPPKLPGQKGGGQDQQPGPALAPLQPDALTGIKPTWRTINRLQNCHAPKQK